jgi:hypothetical protein
MQIRSRSPVLRSKNHQKRLEPSGINEFPILFIIKKQFGEKNIYFVILTVILK